MGVQDQHSSFDCSEALNSLPRVCVCSTVSVVSDSLQLYGLQPIRLFVHGIPQARTLEWVAVPSSGDLPDLGIEPMSPEFQVDSLPLNHQESPSYFICNKKGNMWSENDLFHPALNFGRLTLQTTSTSSTSGFQLLAAGGNRRVGGK